MDSPATFDQHCLPGIAAFGGADATLMTSADKPVAATYNQVLEASLDFEDVEAIVLLRQDVEITDPHFRRKVIAAFAQDTKLGVLGPGDGALRAVDCLDARCLILRPDLAARLRFDDAAFDGPDGYEVDFCARVVAAGHGVARTALDLVTHEPCGGVSASEQGRRSAAAVWQGRRAKEVGLRTLAMLAHRSAHDPVGSDLPAGSVPPSSEFPRFTSPELLEQLPRDLRRVLHLGCGSGLLGARIAQHCGAEVTGVEVDARQAKIAATMLHDVVALDLNTAVELPFADAHFDAIVLDGLLERILDPAAVLRMARRCLQPDGKIIATARNVKHWSVVLPLLLEDRWEYTPTGTLSPASLRHYTMGQLAELFRDAGLGQFDACLTQQVPLADPEELTALVTCLAGYGTDPDQTRLLLNTYEFLIVAGRRSA